MSPPRVVLDTNVLLSALLFRGGAVAWLRQSWQSGGIHPLASQATAAELLRVLSYPKFHLTGDEQEDLLGDYLPWCEIVSVPDSIVVPDCRDFSDRPFLALAKSAQADALVTGDKDLLALSKTFAVPIMEPAELRNRMFGKQ